MEKSERERRQRKRGSSRSPINTRGQASMLSLWQERPARNGNFSRDVNKAFSYIDDSLNHRLACEINTIVHNYRSGNFCKDVSNSNETNSGGTMTGLASEKVRVELDGLPPSKWIFETPKCKRLVIPEEAPSDKYQIGLLDYLKRSSSSVEYSIIKDIAHQPDEQDEIDAFPAHVTKI